MSNLSLSLGHDRDQWQFFLGVAEMSTFNFLTCKSIFHLSEHHKFEYFSQPWWDIQVCEKIKFMERWKRNGLYRNIRQSLGKWVRKWTYMKLIWNIGISVSISNSTLDMSCSAHVFSTGLMAHFSDLFSYLLMSSCHFVFRMGFFSNCFKQLTWKKQK